MDSVDDLETLKNLELLIVEAEKDHVDFNHRVRAFNSFYERAIDLMQRIGLTEPGNPVVLKFQDLQKTRSREVHLASALYAKARKTNAPKKRMTEFHRAQEDAQYHMSIDMRGFLRALRETSHSTLT